MPVADPPLRNPVERHGERVAHRPRAPVDVGGRSACQPFANVPPAVATRGRCCGHRSPGRRQPSSPSSRSPSTSSNAVVAPVTSSCSPLVAVRRVTVTLGAGPGCDGGRRVERSRRRRPPPRVEGQRSIVQPVEGVCPRAGLDDVVAGPSVIPAAAEPQGTTETSPSSSAVLVDPRTRAADRIAVDRDEVGLAIAGQVRRDGCDRHTGDPTSAIARGRAIGAGE